jgi:hypothetical protein
VRRLKGPLHWVRQALLGDNMSAQQAMLREVPDVVVATPSRLLAHIKAGNVHLQDSVETLGKAQGAKLIIDPGKSCVWSCSTTIASSPRPSTRQRD